MMISWFFSGVTEEDILSEITEEMENDDDDTDKNKKKSQATLRSVQSLRAFFSSLSSIPNDDHFRAFDSMQTLFVDLTVKKVNKQTKILDFFDKISFSDM
ncbi:hypothetical protein AVEN_180049-1 [Araneus ventricosus]|uniref:Uncharacterized protein n=1 Tax=Araneus ventricosus TaxID=182803 RepID=A0A4Y2JMR5_ARAVE|nr:hypothetical protein AVEN_180049-1 [Araneus ventricosus]